MATETESNERQFLEIEGPRPDVSYPLNVVYCGECTMPLEYCEYYPNYERCKKWLEKNLPDEFSKLMCDKGEEDGDGDTDKKRQKRGGKGQIKTKKKSEPQGIKLGTAKRGKKKRITVVIGLGTYDIDLKDASKVFSSKFSCGSAVTGDDEIVIQGDVSDDLFDFLPEKWPQVTLDDSKSTGPQEKFERSRVQVFESPEIDTSTGWFKNYTLTGNEYLHSVIAIDEDDIEDVGEMKKQG